MTQIARTYELAQKHLSRMVAQRDELNTAIDELKAQLKWGEEYMAQHGIDRAAE